MGVTRPEQAEQKQKKSLARQSPDGLGVDPEFSDDEESDEESEDRREVGAVAGNDAAEVKAATAEVQGDNAGKAEDEEDKEEGELEETAAALPRETGERLRTQTQVLLIVYS